jgi:hypothetical protein
MALEHILSIVLHSCPGTALVKLIFGREDRGFLLFSSHFPLKDFLPKPAKRTLDGQMWGEKKSSPHTRLVPSILLKFQSFHSSRAYSIVLRSCSAMALVGMIFGW